MGLTQGALEAWAWAPGLPATPSQPLLKTQLIPQHAGPGVCLAAEPSTDVLSLPTVSPWPWAPFCSEATGGLAHGHTSSTYLAGLGGGITPTRTPAPAPPPEREAALHRSLFICTV